jgi:prophage regulatory protein
MLQTHGAFEMRLLSKKQVREMVLYSPQHIQRLEDAGRFPRRVRLGQGRVGWVEQEVLDWLTEKIRQRDEQKLSI